MDINGTVWVVEREYPADYLCGKEELERCLRAESENARTALRSVHPEDTQESERVFREHNQRCEPIFQQLINLEQKALPVVILKREPVTK
jgi:hypothetical protein